MGRATVPAIYGLVTLAFSSCATEVCDCLPAIVPAQPRPGSEGLENSDTNLLVMDFKDELTLDSARVELVLRAQ